MPVSKLFWVALLFLSLSVAYGQDPTADPLKKKSNLTEKQQKKLKKLVKKQELSEDEQQLKAKVESGMSTSKKARRKYNRTYYRQSKAKKEYDDYLREIHLSHQSEATQKMMRETRKKSKIRWMQQNGNAFQRWWYRNK